MQPKSLRTDARAKLHSNPGFCLSFFESTHRPGLEWSSTAQRLGLPFAGVGPSKRSCITQATRCSCRIAQRQQASRERDPVGPPRGNVRVARRFVVRQAPGGEWEAEEHAVEYDTEDSLDVLHFQIFSLTSVSPDLQKIVVEADGSVVDDGTDLESISKGLRLVSIDEGEDADAAAAAVTRAQEKSDDELVGMIQVLVSWNRPAHGLAKCRTYASLQQKSICKHPPGFLAYPVSLFSFAPGAPNKITVRYVSQRTTWKYLKGHHAGEGEVWATKKRGGHSSKNDIIFQDALYESW
ncbi:uncharacterized protein LOC104582622 [Brachypodium distachyon]|uniref:uncharacterized protein LOC104582622 n=1 Tax=Brachypodium distachyon TaxID=15368 RepID=UPI00071C9A41|nr:uncharacterized protein LOC104582622 [Brachypodium distachyon]|eukprot:XP_014754038.1 uncharacterized protein LOC104582622 [Brachypodium distachyon]